MFKIFNTLHFVILKHYNCIHTVYSILELIVFVGMEDYEDIIYYSVNHNRCGLLKSEFYLSAVLIDCSQIFVHEFSLQAADI